MDTKNDPIFKDCPTHNTPEFKECHHCEECAVLKAWNKELKNRQKKSWWRRFINLFGEIHYG